MTSRVTTRAALAHRIDNHPRLGLWIVGLGIAVFIPYKYVYPSRLSNHALRYFTSYSGLLWAIVLGWTVLNPATASQYHVAELSLAYPALYLGLSFKLGGLHRG